jgi:hypothetical protein
MVGSHDFARVDISGQVDNVMALNQPGSTMKPITYVTAFMQGWSPATMVKDEPLKTGDGSAAFTLGNADNTLTDLYSNTANLMQPVTIRRVDFTGTWDEAFPPTITPAAWFEGFIGRASIRGERLFLECHADMGRRGTSPKTKSRSLMLNHQPLSPQQKLTIIATTSS